MQMILRIQEPTLLAIFQFAADSSACSGLSAYRRFADSSACRRFVSLLWFVSLSPIRHLAADSSACRRFVSLLWFVSLLPICQFAAESSTCRRFVSLPSSCQLAVE
jgi:hypothetical protein